MSKVFGYIEKVKNAKTPESCTELNEELEKLNAQDGSQQDVIDLICVCLNNPRQYILESAKKLLSLIKWKNYYDGIVQILDNLMTKPDTKHLDNDSGSRDVYDALTSFCDKFIESTKSLPSNENVASKWCQLSISQLTKRHKWYTCCVHNLSSDTPDDWFVVKPELKENYITSLTKLFEDHDDNSWYLENSFYSVCSWGWSRLCNSVKADAVHKKCWDAMYKLWSLLQNREIEQQNNATVFGLASMQIVLNFLVLRITRENCESSYYQVFLPSVLKWHNNNELTKMEIDMVKEFCSMIVAHLMANNPSILPQENIENYCKEYLKSRDIQSISIVLNAYQNGDKQTKETVEKYSPQFIQMLQKCSNDATQLGQLLKHIYNSNSKIFGKEEIDTVESALDTSDSASSTAIALLEVISRKEKNLFKNRGNSYLNMVRKFNNEYCSSTRSCLALLKNIAFINEEHANRIVDQTDKEIQQYPNNQYVLPTALSYEFQIAQMYPNIFQKRIPTLEKYKSYPNCKAQAQAIIDLAEGRSLQKVSDDVEVQDKKIKVLDKDVGQNKANIDMLDKRADQQDSDINENRQNIQRTNVEVNSLGQRVDKAEDKIEDIDNKTVSNAPAWSKEVSKLLNPKGTNDWTLVAQRLNYNSSEIRGWATQPDPTMSMLAEFYTTNRTSEATRYLLKILQDLNRQDAVLVIEKYNKQTETVVTDNDQDQYKPPPGVFISYQWGAQEKIKLLKDNIEREGYACWMDLGQMGGGDMLYDKINEGIRGAKIVILCMTDLYCKSANCIREVNLANGLDKTIVPIILEKDLAWPPPGSMGPILAGKLFIRFFQRDNENTNDERYWPPDKYNELMDKIRSSVGKSIVLETLNRSTNAAPAKEHKQCQVCITCSPDKEPSMKALQRDLQAAGYSTSICCYVEESVAEVQANVYVAALCLRYTKSSLALKEIEHVVNERKKPLIPLLMDRTEYPPMGQMKKYFTRTSAINCCNNNPTNGSRQFDDIVDLIKNYKQNSNSESESYRQRSFSKSDSSSSLSRTKEKPPNVLNNSKARYGSDRRYSNELTSDRRFNQPIRRGQEYNNFFKNKTPANKKPKNPDDYEEPMSYHPDGPKLPSLYRQKLNNRY